MVHLRKVLRKNWEIRHRGLPEEGISKLRPLQYKQTLAKGKGLCLVEAGAQGDRAARAKAQRPREWNTCQELQDTVRT